MTARKTGSRKKSTRKKKTRKKSSGRKRGGSSKSALQRIEDELPKDLKSYSRRVRRGLSQLEKEIEGAGRDARKRWTRLLRDVSHQLGTIEAKGEKEFRRRTTKVRRDAVKVLKRLEKAIAPPRSRKKKASKKKARKKKATRKKKSTRKKSGSRKAA